MLQLQVFDKTVHSNLVLSKEELSLLYTLLTQVIESNSIPAKKKSSGHPCPLVFVIHPHKTYFFKHLRQKLGRLLRFFHP